ncbi:FemAB family PEP-CTERM system-associated protein [Geomonas sp. Red875]|uniref:FemAB family PEP-CTERM system-associated protein n=2 Tax=Geomesophilobacter sediminis TaxID=2798584 RepID=A0A8J7J5H5_9BACT|nr:FemAB family PEP-CTERM system-associated protein [Geomesophilobacter sediminis]
MLRSVSTDTDPGSWDAFVSGHPLATGYHRYGWKEVIVEAFGHVPYFLSACDEVGGIQGVLPLIHMKSVLFGNFLVSVPFVNYGGLLCNSTAAAEALLAKAERLRCELGADHVELRHLGAQVPGLPTRQHKVTMLLTLADDAERQWQTFNCKLRNQIRKAQKCGLECISGGLELLDEFYAVFARNMRDLGTPVYSRDFFRRVLAAFPEETRVFVVRSGAAAVGGGIAFWFRTTVEVPWASSISSYRTMCPNDLLYWEVIRFAIDRGFRTLDFGRSTPGEGTYHFKKQWGAEPVPLNWQYLFPDGTPFPELNPKNPKFRLAVRLWKQLPLVLTNLIGPRLVRNIP